MTQFKDFQEGINPYNLEVRQESNGAYSLYIQNVRYTVSRDDGKKVTDQLNLDALVQLLKTPTFKPGKDTFTMKISNSMFTFQKS